MTTQNEAGVTTRSTWKLDPAHTLVEFSGKHMMFTTVKGHFKSVRGTIVLDEADPSPITSMTCWPSATRSTYQLCISLVIRSDATNR